MDDINSPANILVCGDFVPQARVANLIEMERYEQLFGDLMQDIRQADLAIVNLEVPLLSKGTCEPMAKSGPCLRGSEKSADALAFAGFKLVTLANNHIMDYGWQGLESTIRTCSQAGLACVGAGSNRESARKAYWHECKGRRIAIINAAENEWATTHDEHPGANPLDSIELYHDIREAASQADHTMVILHGGHEGYRLPSPRLKKVCRFLIDIGADAVLGHHTHCFSGSETYKGKPIVYSLGNFAYDAKNRQTKGEDWHRGCAVLVSFLKDAVESKLIPFLQFLHMQEGIRCLNDAETEAFVMDAERRNEIIQDDSQLEQQFDAFIRRKERMYRTMLEPVRNRLILAAMNWGFIPRFIRGRHKRYLLNLIRCEAHRDIVMHLLEE